jgi:hypothetical protein
VQTEVVRKVAALRKGHVAFRTRKGPLSRVNTKVGGEVGAL